MPETLSVGALIAAVVGLFGLLIGSLNQRANRAEDRAKELEGKLHAAQEGRISELLESSQQLAAMNATMADCNAKLSELTRMVIDRRPSTGARS